MTKRVIDIHSHHYPRWYIERLKRRTEIPRVVGEVGAEHFVIFPEEEREGAHGAGGRPMDAEYWDIGAKLAFMDRFGIDQTVLTLGNPWLDPIEGAESVDLARRLNTEYSELERETDGRIVGMGVLPANDVRTAAAVAGEVAETPTLYGLIGGPRICGRLFDDPELDPVWRVLDSTGLPLLLHPHYAAAADELQGYGHAFPVSLGFPFETTIAVARLVFGGVYRRFPHLQVIASHGGGTIPYLAGRLDAGWQSDPDLRGRLPYPPSEDLAKVYLDAVLYHPRALRAAADLVGTARMSFGTDHPFSVSDPSSNLRAIAAAFAGQERENVLSRSAGVLFGFEAR